MTASCASLLIYQYIWRFAAFLAIIAAQEVAPDTGETPPPRPLTALSQSEPSPYKDNGLHR
ncbi:hypothetical protein A9Q95_05565 [Rhodobacterales bacterium 59_46_T64]|nr:hypothetical protein A9Q95_05565 [Rhodobacterales bacterium 59_46_T64]